MKSPEFVPRNEEQKEEDERLYKNDSGIYEKGSKYMPIEEIVDPSTEEGDSLVDIDDELEEEDVDNEPLDEDELKEKKQLDEVLKKQKIGFAVNEDGSAASVGPEFDVNKEKKENIKEEKERFKPIEEEQMLETSNIISSPAKEKINAVIYGFKNRKDYSSTKGEGKDNLKTMDYSKKEKMARGNIREIQHNPDKIDY